MVSINKLLKHQTTFTNDYFEGIADIILNKTILVINCEPFRIYEIEFYLNSEGHPDKYTHSDLDKLSYGYWYFHRYKGGKYKGGNHKGFDIALGNRYKRIYCGILIRSIYDLKNKVMIEGPCRSVNKILELYGTRSIQDFVGDEQLRVLENHRNLILVVAENKISPKTIFKNSTNWIIPARSGV